MGRDRREEAVQRELLKERARRQRFEQDSKLKNDDRYAERRVRLTDDGELVDETSGYDEESAQDRRSRQ
jgi:hypothetical protein